VFEGDLEDVLGALDRGDVRVAAQLNTDATTAVNQ